MNEWTISGAARAARVGVETIRFYERKGLIVQPQRPHGGGFRTYSEEAVKRIRFIRKAQELGFSLREIGELLSLRADPNTECADVQVQAATKLKEVESKIADLQRIRSALKDLMSSCPKKGPAVGHCTILEALGPSGT